MSPQTPEPGNVRRRCWWWTLAAIIAAGLLSRTAHTGYQLADKYLGDALYAAMVYVLLLLTGRVRPLALWTALIMLAIETFQLTGIPAAMFRNPNSMLRASARLLGTEFSLADLAAYAAGIACIAALRSVLSPSGTARKTANTAG